MPMTFQKALRILPSFVAHVAKGQSDLSVLRRRVEGESLRLGFLIFDQLNQTHSGDFRTQEVKALELKKEQLDRWLEATK